MEKILYYDKSQGALGFEDVLIVPRHSVVESRWNDDRVDTSVAIAYGLPAINLPFLAAGMDTAAEAKLAITLGLQGGFTEIHRNNLPHQQVAIVTEVKDRLRVTEEDPPLISGNATIEDGLAFLEKRKRGYIIVFDGSEYTGKFAGIVSPRDLNAAPVDTPIKSVMTPFERVKTVPVGTTLEQAVVFMKEHRLEKVPIIDEDGTLKGVYSMKDHNLYSKYPNAALDAQGRLLVGAAIGAKQGDIERAHLLEEAGADALFLDIAWGDSIRTERMMHILKNSDDKVKVPVIVGNFAPFSGELMEGEGVLFAVDTGADAIKVGVGAGLSCDTRVIAGVGVPMITAIMNARQAMDKLQHRIPIIADGGVRIPRDAAAAIVAGADAVMMGSLFAGTSDSPGNIIMVDGRQMKIVRGMASAGVFEDRLAMGEVTTDPVKYKQAAEGREKLLPYSGDTKDIIYKFEGGLRSAMSYTNSYTIYNLQTAQLIHITTSASQEHRRDLG